MCLKTVLLNPARHIGAVYKTFARMCLGLETNYELMLNRIKMPTVHIPEVHVPHNLGFTPIIFGLFIVLSSYLLYFHRLRMRNIFLNNENFHWATVSRRSCIYFLGTSVFNVVTLLLNVNGKLSMRVLQDNSTALVYTIGFCGLVVGFYAITFLNKPNFMASEDDSRVTINMNAACPFCSSCFLYAAASNFLSVILLILCSQVNCINKRMLFGFLSLGNNAVQYFVLSLCHQERLVKVYQNDDYNMWLDTATGQNPLIYFVLFALSYWIYFSDPNDAVQEFFVIGHFCLLIAMFIIAFCLNILYKPQDKETKEESSNEQVEGNEQLVHVERYIDNKVKACTEMQQNCIRIGRSVFNLTESVKNNEPDSSADHLIKKPSPKWNQMTEDYHDCKLCGKRRVKTSRPKSWKRQPRKKFAHVFYSNPRRWWKCFRCRYGKHVVNSY